MTERRRWALAFAQAGAHGRVRWVCSDVLYANTGRVPDVGEVLTTRSGKEVRVVSVIQRSGILNVELVEES